MAEQRIIDGDRGFRGVEMRLDPAILAPGWVAAARNARFREGKAVTRKGIVKLKWTTLLGETFPLIFPLNFERRLAFNTVYGAGRFDDPSGVEWLALAAASVYGVGKVWVTRPNNALVEEPLPAGENITGPCRFVQAFDKLFLFRGEDLAPLVLDAAGTGVGFRALGEAEEGTGLEKTPNAADALWIQNRLVIPHGRDLVDVSDVLDPEHVYTTTNRFRINQGSSDSLVGLFKFNEFTVVCAKQSSVIALANLIPDEVGRFSNATADEVTTAWGFVAARSMVARGPRLYGLSQEGVMAIEQTAFNKLQVPREEENDPSKGPNLSKPIQPLIDRINWKYARNACGAIWDSKYYLAVPLDRGEVERNQIVPVITFGNGTPEVTLFGFEPGRRYRVYFATDDEWVKVNGEEQHLVGEGVFEFAASIPGGAVPIYTQPYVVIRGKKNTALGCRIYEVFAGVNNAVLVYDFVTGAWAGYDDGEAVMVLDWVKLDVDGRERLLFVSADGFLNLYEEGHQDDGYEWYGYESLFAGLTKARGVVRREIDFDLVTRGYGKHEGMTRFDPNNKNWQRTGAEARGCEAAVSLATWNPVYSIYERPDGVGEEVALISGKARSRTRYDQWNKADWDPTNVNLDHGTARREDYAVSFDVVGGVKLGTGIDLELLQRCVERVKLHGRGGTVQLRIRNTQGRVEVLGVELAAIGGRKRFGALV